MSTTTAESLPGPVSPVSQLYTWSAWVHVGPGAENCEAINEADGQNDCSNPLHFHAFCRLPNQFQHKIIHTKAKSAKARTVRLLRDFSSDEAVILEDELDRIARQGDSAKPLIVDEIVGRDWWRDYLEAQYEVRERETDKDEKPYEFLDEDREKYQELSTLPEEDRDEEQIARLESHLNAYAAEVDEAVKRISGPRRAALLERDINALLDIVRDARIDVESNENFLFEYAALEWLICTLRKPEGDPVFVSREAMERADSAVIDAIKATYNDLEKSYQRGGGPGNS